MENFFKFIDNLGESIIVLYDKNFFYTNRHLLISLEFDPIDKPVSLKQIIDSEWLEHLKKMEINQKSEVKLKTQSGKEK